jgi:hypothetical protein
LENTEHFHDINTGGEAAGGQRWIISKPWPAQSINPAAPPWLQVNLSAVWKRGLQASDVGCPA